MRPAVLCCALAACGGAPFLGIDGVPVDASSSSEAPVSRDASALDALAVDALAPPIVDARSDARPLVDASARDAIGEAPPIADAAVDGDACAADVHDDVCPMGAGSSTFDAPEQFCLEGAQPSIVDMPAACLCEYSCACLLARWSYSCGVISSCGYDARGGLVVVCQ